MWWAALLNNLVALLGTAGGGAGAGAYESIATANGDGSSGLITFSSIPSDFKHLQLRFIGKDTYSGGAGPSNMQIRMNSDSTEANYYYHYLRGNGSTASASAGNSPSFLASVSTSSDNADIFGVGVIDILDYGNTSKNKVIRALSGGDANGSGLIVLYSGSRNLTDAITSITIFPTGAGDFREHSSFALYGVK